MALQTYWLSWKIYFNFLFPYFILVICCTMLRRSSNEAWITLFYTRRHQNVMLILCTDSLIFSKHSTKASLKNMSKLCFFVAASRFVCLTQCIKQPPKRMTIIAVQCMRKLNSHTESGGFNSIIAIILLLAWLFYISLIEIFFLI